MDNPFHFAKDFRMHRKPNFIVYFLMSCCTLFLTTGTSFAQSMQKVSPDVLKKFQFDMHHNVGKPLPAGIKFVDDKGKTVDLRTRLKALGGPAILLVVTTRHCPPCHRLLDYIRKSPPAEGHAPHLVVVRINDPGHASLSLPGSVLALHTAGALDKGFLARHFVPATFIFNKHLTLIKRRTGLTSPQNTLRYPVKTSAATH